MKTTIIKDLLGLTLMIGLFWGITLGRHPIAVPDSARYVEIPREMTVTGDYVTPHLNGLKYFEKPPLFYWMQAGALKLFKLNEISVCIVNALLMLGIAILIYLMGITFYDRMSGLLAASGYACTILAFALTRLICLDTALTFFLTAFLTCFLSATRYSGKKRTILLVLSYLSCGCAVLTKGIVGAGFSGLLVIYWLTAQHEWKNLKSYHPLLGLSLFLAVVLPWHLLVQLKNPEFSYFYFVEQHFLRFVTDYADRAKPFWFLPVILLAGIYPWTTILFPAVVKGFKTSAISRTLIYWSCGILLFFSLSRSQLMPYILPIIPTLMLLIGNYLAPYFTSLIAPSRAANFALYFTAGISVVIALSLFFAAPLIDLNLRDFTANNLLTLGIIFAVTGLITFYYHQRHTFTAGIIALVFGTGICLLYASPYLSTIHSIKPLILTVKSQLKPPDIVIDYENYHQDIPVYLERTITVVNYQGELAFGIEHNPKQDWMINTKQFWKLWLGDKTCYLFIEEPKYLQLMQNIHETHPTFVLLDKYKNTLLFRNRL